MKIYLHPLPLRVWHWIFAALTIVLIVTGVQLRVPGMESFSGYRSAVLVHKYAGYLMAACFLFWFVYSVVNGSLKRHYSIRPREIKGMVRQGRFYLFGVFKGEENPFHPSPEDKFNALQKMAYIFIMLVFTPIIVITGILFSDILFFRPVIHAIGGIRILDTIHVIAAYVFVEYLVVHIYMATLGRKPLEHIKAMFTGYEEQPVQHGAVQKEGQ